MNVDPTGHAFWNKIKRAVKRTAAKAKAAVKGVVTSAVSTIQAVVDNIGAVVSTGKEIPDEIYSSFFTTVETGVGYNKDFGNGKAVNIFAQGSSILDGSIGVDVNINGNGASVEAGLGKSAITLHLGKKSIEFGATAAGIVYKKEVYKENGTYVYCKTSHNLNHYALAAVPTVIACVLGGYISPLCGRAIAAVAAGGIHAIP